MVADRYEEGELELPPLEAVEAALRLDEEDRRELPGLHRMNTHDLPMARLLGVVIALVVAPVHNAVVLGDPRWGTVGVLAAGLLAYSLGSWVALKAWFHRSALHLGFVFVYADLLMFAWMIHATGGPRSLYWPIFVIRIADQMWLDFGRARIMVALSLLVYGGLLASWSVSGVPMTLSTELMKMVVLAGVGVCLILVARSPWDVSERTTAARDLIMRLEEQSVELDEQRRRAQAASRSKSEFLSRMSHELRTPLNSVMGFTNVLLKRVGRPIGDLEKDYLERIRKNGMHLLALINDILDLARIEQGKMDIRLGDVDLAALVHETVDQLGDRVRGRDVRLGAEVPAGMGPVRADEVRLRQVLINLVGNALKFTETGEVVVRVRASGDGTIPQRLEVTDTGPGIASERLDRIFEAFEQAEGGAARRHGGTGLGLAISRSLCVLMDFRLTVDSTEGEGSTFTVWFADAAGTSPPNDAPAPRATPSEPSPSEPNPVG